jgi:protein-tyrosine phosphatase
MKILSRSLLLIAVLLFGIYCFISWPDARIDRGRYPSEINNLHLIDEDPATGFAIYRLGEPDSDGVQALCDLGVSEIAVLAGTAMEHEVANVKRCPTLEIVYNHEDDLSPLSAQWLEAFDAWVARAKAEGRKVAFRCTCGCHRTGRLAAYYQMRHRGLQAQDAWHLALARGSIMHAVDYFSSLQEQILALEEHILGVPCTQGEFCVVEEADGLGKCDDPKLGCGWQTDLTSG